MGRRKQYMDDGDDSSDDEGGRIRFDITDQDLEEEAEGFYGQHKTNKKRKRFGEDYTDDEQEEEETYMHGGLGLGAGSSSSTVSPMAKFMNFTTAKSNTKSATASPQSTSASPEPSTLTPNKRQERKMKAQPSSDFGKFNAYSTGFGQRMLEKMGWKTGEGLGESGSGIVNPIETKLRPKQMGIGFRGFSERTEEQKQEAKRRGEVGSSDEDEDMEEATALPGDFAGGKQPLAKREAWKRKSRKPKSVFKTAAAILAESTNDDQHHLQQPATQQKIIDMTGPQIKEVTMADLQQSATWIETTTRLPELRHNLRLIVDLAKGDLENLSRDKQSNALRMKTMEEECEVIRHRKTEEETRMTKIQDVKEMALDLKNASRNALATVGYEHANVTALFGHVFEQMQQKYSTEIEQLGLDQLVVAVWAPIMKFKSAHWDVLVDPTWGAADVQKWRSLLVSNDDPVRDETGLLVPRPKSKETLKATPYETMMNTIWLVRVRSAINNQWNIRDPDPLVQLLETWKPLLPRFIFENIVNQLVLPKISRAVSDWDPRNDPEMIHTWIHPWLPVLEAWRLGELFTTIRHKLAVVLRVWHPSDESALHIIMPWKEVWTRQQMESFINKSVLPKLTRIMRDEFIVNPREQQLDPLIWCMAWKDIISEPILSQLIENEFFTKWLDVLYKWLTLSRDRVNYDEVREWYLWWRQVFGSYELDENKVVSASFRKGLDMMAMAANGQPVIKS
ncbi:GC-rich sequence DNA-binding factor-like protein-domain-containing protein [Phascolomyces articulosus]|uniref:GC-rich sequence DNA-binding factor-like protein-domain-containing protein n=1 Tax=Phascolomyces articulosus TaxID=60185 RepID=A0AAD5PBX5_9FUNG|nr:GC-rich sequence DNA-binding factor-like protein-domain-containing protein [Phascolomyces articulosus]